MKKRLRMLTAALVVCMLFDVSAGAALGETSGWLDILGGITDLPVGEEEPVTEATAEPEVDAVEMAEAPAETEVDAVDMYERSIAQLRSYLNREGSEIPLNELADRFMNDMNGYKLSFELGVYAQALWDVEQGDFSRAYAYVDILQSNSRFAKWVAADEAFGTLEQLAWYVRGREAEMACRFADADEAYRMADGFYDSTMRRVKLMSVTPTPSPTPSPTPTPTPTPTPSPTPFVRRVKQANVASGDYRLTVYNDNTCDIVDYVGVPNVLEIPEWIDGYRVTGIEAYAFSGLITLIRVTIPEGVTSIKDYAFSWCTALTSVTIPKGVTSIGAYAFNWCSALTSVTIPKSVTSIGEYAFNRCSALTSVTIPEGVTSIGDYAFRYCDSLTSVTIPEGVTSIGDYAFFSCDSLTSVTIPASVTRIGSRAFDDCRNLTLRVPRNSYAATYAKENNIPYTYTN